MANRAEAIRVLLELANELISAKKAAKVRGPQARAAEELGLSESQMSKLKTGGRDGLEWETIDLVADKHPEYKRRALPYLRADPRVERVLDPNALPSDARALQLELRVRDHYDDLRASLTPDERAEVREEAAALAGRFGDDKAYEKLLDLIEGRRRRRQPRAASPGEQQARGSALDEQDDEAGKDVERDNLQPFKMPEKKPKKPRETKGESDDDRT